MRRLLGVLVLVATLGATAMPGVAGPAERGKAGAGKAAFTMFIYSTSDLSGLVLQGSFPTGARAFVGTVQQTSYADVTPASNGGGWVVAPFTVAGSSLRGNHALTGSCSGSGRNSAASQGGLVMDARLALTCTTSVDGGSPRQSRLAVVAAGTGGDAATHGQEWTYDGGFAGRAVT